MSHKHRTIGLMRNSRLSETKALLQRFYPELEYRDVTQLADLDEVDFVLGGGGKDIDPSLYGQGNRSCKAFDPEADRLDLQLMQEVLARDIPFLGICRGAQLLNIALGGTLYQDLRLERGCRHQARHSITPVRELQSLLNGLNTVNSSHHQGIDRLGESLKVLATAEDGLPELVWRPRAIGTQYHPELLIHEDARWKVLFDWWLAGAPALPDHDTIRSTHQPTHSPAKREAERQRDVDSILLVFPGDELNYRTASLTYIPCPVWVLPDGTEIQNERGAVTPHYWPGYLDRLLKELPLNKRRQVVVIPQHDDLVAVSRHLRMDLPMLLEDLKIAGFTPLLHAH